jgi:hypothetical protein
VGSDRRPAAELRAFAATLHDDDAVALEATINRPLLERVEQRLTGE